MRNTDKAARSASMFAVYATHKAKSGKRNPVKVRIVLCASTVALLAACNDDGGSSEGVPLFPPVDKALFMLERPSDGKTLGVLAGPSGVADMSKARDFCSGSPCTNTTPVEVWQADDKTLPMQQSPLHFTMPFKEQPPATTVALDEYVQMQKFIGVGAAMTDTSAYNLSVLPRDKYEAVIQALFSRDKGAGISFVRFPMGSSDFAATPPARPIPYSYDDVEKGSEDPNLTRFSIDHDRSYIIPALLAAKKVNPDLFFMANPWSPPGWMKISGVMYGGDGRPENLTSTGSELKPSSYGPLARYFVKVVQSYAKEGVKISAISPQNEPAITSSSYPNMQFSAADVSNFVRDHLQPALKALDSRPAIWINDDNYSQEAAARTILKNVPTVEGVAWHGYYGQFDVQSRVHNQLPLKDMIQTEYSIGIGNAAPPERIIGPLRNWAIGSQYWNLALDQNGGPKMGGGCGGCTGTITVDTTTKTYSFKPEYYYMAAFGRFVLPGARRLLTSQPANGYQNVAFKNPDGTIVLVVNNNLDRDASLTVTWMEQGFATSIPRGKLAVFRWRSGSAPLKTNTLIAVGASGDRAGLSSDESNLLPIQVKNTGTYTSPSVAAVDLSKVPNPLPQAAYLIERYGAGEPASSFAYAFPNLDATKSYLVRLHFAEVYFDKLEQRKFNVSINGAKVLGDFDIIREAGGKAVAVIREFTQKPASDSSITIAFERKVGGPKVNAVEILAAP